MFRVWAERRSADDMLLVEIGKEFEGPKDTSPKGRASTDPHSRGSVTHRSCTPPRLGALA